MRNIYHKHDSSQALIVLEGLDPKAHVKPETLALILGVSYPTLAKWRMKSSSVKGPRYYKVGKNVMYRVSHVLEWLEASVVTPMLTREFDNDTDIDKKEYT